MKNATNISPKCSGQKEPLMQNDNDIFVFVGLYRNLTILKLMSKYTRHEYTFHIWSLTCLLRICGFEAVSLILILILIALL